VSICHIIVALFAAAVLPPAFADELAIRKAIAERLPAFPKIDDVTRMPIPGLYELRVGTDVFYADERGDHLIQGQVIDTKSQNNLTVASIGKLTAIDVAALPLKDAIVWKQGSGARKLVVFADPNCGYCKRFEHDLLAVKDVTVYTFLYPILGPDSQAKARDIWCSKDSAKAWRDWMLNGIAPARPTGGCDAATLARNLALGLRHRLTGTPTLVFKGGQRAAGALSAEQVEKELAKAT